jgi:ribosomal protein S18 acetylase RimI-like enzyme/predicted GNAT family N-acyltransferase
MPTMRITELSEQNLEHVLAAWNAALTYDSLTARRFCRVFLEDPNREPGGILVAEGGDGAVLGFSACVARHTVEGKDGRGGDWEFKRAFLKGFFVLPGDDETAIADSLLAAAEAYAARAGKEEMRLTEYAGPYVFPGLDIRYERLHGILSAHGYRDERTIEDVAVDLNRPELPSLLARAQDRVGPSAEVVTWRPEMLPAMQAFVAQTCEPQWFPDGWERSFGEPEDHVLILRRGEEILGWAEYRPTQPAASFGPILVPDSMRGNGYGSVLLLECMVRSHQQGSETMAAGWANTGFYVANGWHISRRYAVFTKSVSHVDP